MAIIAKIVEHSVSPAGKELITFELQYPRFIHSEVMTHRVFSRNAASSRAIPVKKMLEQIKADPVVPLHWGANQPGMQAREQVNLERRAKAEHEWRRAAQHAAYFAESLHDLGIHKQIVNRVVEPFMWMRTIATATELDNFWELRRHEDAEPHFQILAERMWEAAVNSTPRPRDANAKDVFQWHLPYVLEAERFAVAQTLGEKGGFFLAQISAARCARVSYLTHDGREPELDEDLKLFNRLAGSRPIHASPLEHQAFPANHPNDASGNFYGWMQFRKFVEAGIAAGHQFTEETTNA